MSNNIDSLHCVDCECISTCFKKLNDDQLKIINQNRAKVTYKKGEILCKQGTFASHIIYVKKGLIKLYLEDNNKHVVLSIETNGYFIGLQYLFDYNILEYSVSAYEETEVCMFEINKFKELIYQNPEFSISIISTINDYTIRSYQRLSCLTQRQLHGRTATILMCLSQRIYRSLEFTMSLSRKNIAEITNMSIESCSRILKEFAEENIININGKNIKIIDLEKLEHISKVG